MNMKQQQIQQNRPFSDEIMNDDDTSLTLTVGGEMLNMSNGNAAEAIKNYPCHSTEIALTSIVRKMDEMRLTREVEALFCHVLSLITVADEMA